MTDAETKERTALAREWVRWDGRKGTDKQVEKVTLSLEMLRRMCVARGIGGAS